MPQSRVVTFPASHRLTTAIGALHALVLDLFTAEEFRRWLRLGPDVDILPEIPGEAAADASVIEKALGVLARHGRIDRAFFTRMTAARERKGAAIAEVATLWCDADRPSSSESPRPVPAASIDRQMVRRALQQRLPTDADFEAFGHDIFPEAAQRWSGGMDRTQKTTLLLNCEGASAVLARLQAYTEHRG